MGTSTPNHDFYVPDTDEIGWAAEKNADWEDLDVRVPISDTLTNRPAPGTEGRWFLDTDNLELYYDNGTDWDAVVSDMAHSDLTGISSDDHHARYTDSEALGAVESHGSPLDIDISGDADTLDGSDASAFATSGHTHTHGDLTGISADDHHARYTDTEAVDAIEAESTITVDIEGELTVPESATTDVSESIDFGPLTNNGTPSILARNDKLIAASGTGFQVNGDGHTNIDIRPQSVGDAAIRFWDADGTNMGRFRYDESLNELTFTDSVNGNDFFQYEIDSELIRFNYDTRIQQDVPLLFNWQYDFEYVSAANQLRLTDNTASNIVMSIPNGGTPNFPQGVSSEGDSVAVSSTEGVVDIQKDGTDGDGVLNFKTSS